MTRRQQLGVKRQAVGLLTPRQHAELTIGILVVGIAVLWHVTLVLTAHIPFSRPGLTMQALLTGRPIRGLPARYEAAGTGATLAVFGALVVGLMVVVFGALFVLAGRRGNGIVGMASRGEAKRSAGEQRARDRARYTRRAAIDRGLDVDRCPLTEVGTHIANKTDDGEPIVLTHEDQVGVYGPTGGGKTLTVGIPVAIDAPGPLVATSTKPEVLDALVEQRGGLGRIWVFDPLDIANWPERMIWNPIRGCVDSEIATARAKAFTAGMTVDDSSDSSNPFFQTAAGIIIARLLHAAALGDHTIEDVISWALNLKASTAARDILAGAEDAEIMWSSTLKVATDGADETISSVRMTLAQKVEPILSRKVLRQMLPQHGIVEFDATAFVQSQDSLFLITDDNAATNVAPLTTMLLDDVVGAAKRVAARSMTGRLDPILRIVGDEIANTAPMPKLPKSVSDSRGHGVQWFLFFQSLAQIIARWGADGADQLAGSLNCSLVLSGLQDTRGLDRFSELVGSADVEQVSTTLGDRNVATSHNVSTTERRLMRGDQIRQLPENKALMIYRNAPAMVVDLIPWIERSDAASIEAGIDHIRRVRIAAHG